MRVLSGRSRQHSLRWRLSLLLGTVLLATLLIIGASVAYFVFLTEQTAWRARQTEVSQNGAATVSTFIQGVENVLNFVGSVEEGTLITNPTLLTAILRHNDALLEIIRVDRNGRVFASGYRDTDVLRNIFTISQSEWFQQTTAGQTYISNLQISFKDEPYLIIAVPAADGGAVAGRLRMTVLWDVVSDIRFGNTGQTYVINQEGQIIAHPDTELAVANTNIANRPEISEIITAPNYHWQGGYINFEGKRVVGATNAVPGTAWVVITELLRSEAFANTRLAFILLSCGVVIIAMLITGITVPLLNRLIFSPMEQLRAGAEQIGHGNLAYQINLSRRDEVGQVAQAFDAMARRLQHREEELRLARDEALNASRLKSELLAKVSHELRTPLGAILGYTEMLAVGVYGQVNDEQTGVLQRIIKSTKFLTELINELLDQAQIDAGRLELKNVSFDPIELIDEVEARMVVLAQAKALKLTTHFTADLPSTLYGDPQRLEQIIVNLVGNAIKFTDSGSIILRVCRPDKGHWAIKVSDTGPGIPPEAQTRIFEPFRQVDGSVTRLHKGTGLGLSIVKQLTSMMDGQIELDSQLGKGSTFSVILPIMKRKPKTS